jgi:transcriptional regulator with PAS, ATPase and Fis domain
MVISAAAVEALTRYPWPGNIRELQNVIERAVVSADLEILPTHLPAGILGAEARPPSGEVAISIGTPLEDVKELLIQRTLEATGGDKALAAKLLGIHERTIYRSLGKEKP